MTKQLKPCPFCGGEYSFIDDIDYSLNEDIPEHLRDGVCFTVVCYDCNARGCEENTESKAILAWNSRICESQKHINEIKAQAIKEAVKHADGETYIGVTGGEFPPQKQYRAEILVFADNLRGKND